MQRGSQTLTSIFSADNKTTSEKKVKGVQTAERDAALAYRFYYYYELKRTRFDDILPDLEREFFIASNTIVERLTVNDTLLKDIKLNAPTRTQLRKRYPHFNWN